MKVLVFGKTGQVGTELARFAETTCLGREEADLCDPQACAAIVSKTDADIIINAAAYTAVDKAEEEEELAALVNGKTPVLMAKAAAAKNIPFIHISTDYVFDGTHDAPISPDAKTAPINAYGRSKLLGEEGVASANGAFAILRTSWVFSAHGNNFVKTMLRLAESHEHLDIVADQIGGPTSAFDIAATALEMAKAFHRGAGKSGIYHYSGSPDTNWAGFAREIFSQAGLKTFVDGISSLEYPTLAKRPMYSVLNCSSLETCFDIKRPDWRLGLDRVLIDLGVKA